MESTISNAPLSNNFQEDGSKPVRPPSTNLWEWFANTKEKAADIAIKAQEKAADIAIRAREKAHEIRQNYDLESATQVIFQGMGISPVVDSNVFFRGERGNSNESNSSGVKARIDIHYVTENLLSMSFPYDPHSTMIPGSGGNTITEASTFLSENHEGHYMIWNLSEETYDYTLFNEQVLEYKFPGHPAPPLGLLFKICTSIESWLDSDEKNVAVIHCLTGKGRTAAVMSCVLSWIGEFDSPLEALIYVADRRKMSIEELTIPSQRRYVQYFANMLDGVKAQTQPLLLRRIIISQVPSYGTNGFGEENAGCAPYIQLFKNGVLIATALPPRSSTSTSNSNATVTNEIKWIRCGEGSVSFPIDCVVRGDILLRCRHCNPSTGGNRVSMFRAAFHTGYVPAGVMRLTKSQLDGANVDDKFPEDFFIDLIFAPVDTSPANHPSATPNETAANKSSSRERDLPMEFTPVEALRGVAVSGSGTDGIRPTDSGLVLESSSKDRYDQMLHRDTKFWEAIGSRKTRGRKRRSRQFVSSIQDPFSITEANADVDVEEGASEHGMRGAGYDDIEELLSEGARTGATGSSAAAAADAMNKKSISDMDLIMQLAMAAEESPPLPSPPSLLADDQPHNAVAVTEDVSATVADSSSTRATTTPDRSDASSAGMASSPLTQNRDKQQVKAAADVELQALEDLERELGLDGMGLLGSAAPSSSSYTASQMRSAEDNTDPDLSGGGDGLDNLDELEQYLESLSAKPNS